MMRGAARVTGLIGASAAALLAAVCRAAPPAAAGALPDGAAAAQFAQAQLPRSFEFPRDHGPHPEFRQEWWYVTGNLEAATGERFGFELTFFRYALAPAAPTGPSAWRTHQIWMAHFAVSDVAARRFRFAQALSREALGLAGAESSPLRVWLDDWSLAADPGSVVGGAPAWTLHAAQPGYEIELVLEPAMAPVLNGERGLSRKSGEPGAASYYYSVPRLAIRGRLLRAGHPLAVQGLGWLDREWGSGGLSPQQGGWDWFGLQLNDGTALMFYALRDRDGSRDRYSAGTWIDSAGVAHALSDADVEIEVTARWTNAQGDRYPAAWHLRVAGLALELLVRPVLADQELRTTPRYWEGAVEVSGTRAGRSAGGRGYVELVGYAQERPAGRNTGALARLGR